MKQDFFSKARPTFLIHFPPAPPLIFTKLQSCGVFVTKLRCLNCDAAVFKLKHCVFVTEGAKWDNECSEAWEREGKNGRETKGEEKEKGFLPVSLFFSQIIFYFAKNLTVQCGLPCRKGARGRRGGQPEAMKTRIDELLIKQKKYRDGDYSQRRLAEELGVSTFVLSRTLRQEYGMTYAQLVHKYRVRDAMRYLRSSQKRQYTVDDIGLLVGFGNRQSFFSAFKRETGLTPERFRTARLDEEQETNNNNHEH